MEVSNDYNEGEYDEMKKQIIDILLNFQRLDIMGEKGFVSFQTRDFAEEVHIFDKIFPYDDGHPEYVFVFKGYYVLEKELTENITLKQPKTWETGGYRIIRTVGAEGTFPEYDIIKKQIAETLKNLASQEIKGEKGHIEIGDSVDLSITEKINHNKSAPDSHPQYVFQLPGYYSPDEVL